MTDTPRIIERGFESMMQACGLQNAPDVQRKEMRRAFFAGARFYSNYLMTMTDPDDGITETDEAIVEAMEAEMDAFIKDVMESRA